MVEIDFTVPEIMEMRIVTWNLHVDDSNKGRYDMILDIYILTVLGLNLKLSEHLIEACGGTLKGS